MTMPMSATTRPFDAARYIETEDDVVGFLEATSEGWDIDHIARALAIVARAQGMDGITARTGMTRDRLQAMLAANDPPTSGGLYEILDALGLVFRMERKAA